MPCARQACENAQVEQKCSASPSSATVRASRHAETPAGSSPAPTRGLDRARELDRRGCRAGRGSGRSTWRYYATAAGLAKWRRCDRSSTRTRPSSIRGCSRAQRVAEIVVEVDVVAALERARPESRPGTSAAGSGPRAADRRRSAHARGTPAGARRRSRPARSQVARVLAEARADVADRADAEADEVAVGVRRVAHEVAMQACRAPAPARGRRPAARSDPCRCRRSRLP